MGRWVLQWLQAQASNIGVALHTLHRIAHDVLEIEISIKSIEFTVCCLYVDFSLPAMPKLPNATVHAYINNNEEKTHYQTICLSFVYQDDTNNSTFMLYPKLPALPDETIR